MGEAAYRGPRERHSPGPNLALNGPVYAYRAKHMRRSVKIPLYG